jgi:hypothetical protein
MEGTKEEEVVLKRKRGRPRKVQHKPRAKQPPKLPPLRHQARSRIVKALHKDPEYRAKILASLEKARAVLKRQGNSPRLGVPDGWTRGQADMQRVYDGLRADLILDRMKAEGMIDGTKPDDYETVVVRVAGKDVTVKVPKTEAAMAEEALRQAVIGAVSPLTHSKNHLGYVRTVLEWTKPKPASTSNVNLNSEEWLEAALKDNADSGNAAGEGSAS